MQIRRTCSADVSFKHAVPSDYKPAGEGVRQSANVDAAGVQFIVGDCQSGQRRGGSGLQRNVNVPVIEKIAADLPVVDTAIGNTRAVKHVAADLYVFRHARQIVLP